MLGGEVQAANTAWQEWADEGPYPAVDVRNYARDLGLVTAGAEESS